MSFATGLKKEASLGGLAAGAMKPLKSAVQGTEKAVKGAISKTRADYMRGMAKSETFGQHLGKSKIDSANRAASAAGKAPIGQEEAQKMTAGAQKAILERKKKSAKYFKGEKPSFASKHPYATAGLAAGATHLAFGGSDKKDQQGPPVVYGGGQSY